MIFQTTRLTVRPLQAADLPAMFEMQSNPRVMQYTGTKNAQTMEAIEKELEKLIGNYAAPENTFWVWAVERKSDQSFLGTCALILNEDNEHEIGFRFLEKYWGNGYATEVANALVEYAESLPGIPGLVAYVYSANTGSVKVLDRSPLVLEREFFNEKENCLDRVYRIAFG